MPILTFFPAMIFVPLWRTKIEPAWAGWPANNLTPRYFGLESLKFLAVPPAFVCAIIFIYNVIMLTKLKEKIKPYEKDLIIIIVIILVASISFGLGRLSKIRENRVPITIENLGASVEAGFRVAPAAETQIQQDSGAVVASKNGTKYHYPWCAGAQQIKEENKIYFSSIEEAREAGYTPASNCKGLK